MMENLQSLLSLSFANISSKDVSKIKTGLRQIEGILASVCLSSNATGQRSAAGAAGPLLVPKQRSNAEQLPKKPTHKYKQQDLLDDAAFCEFYRLQDGFECNVTTHLITCLERLLSMSPSKTNETLLLSALHILHGMLHIHPPSRALFSREIYVNLLLDLLSPDLPPAIQSTTLAVCTNTLLNYPVNTRVFEQADGLLGVVTLYYDCETTKTVKRSILEFLYFYLLPEQDYEYNHGWDGQTGTTRRRPRPLGHSSGGSSSSSKSHSSAGSHDSYETARTAWASDTTMSEIDERGEIKHVLEKQKLLSKYFSGVSELPELFENMKIYDGILHCDGYNPA